MRTRTRRTLESFAPCAILLAVFGCRPSAAPGGVGSEHPSIDPPKRTASTAEKETAQVKPNPSKPVGTEKTADAALPGDTEVAYFAGGCFWGLEHYFQLGPGVIDAVSGYMQGFAENPTYREVCSGTAGHAETVKVVFDPKRITYRRLLEAFFAMHDPTTVDRQGPDVGSQYRSGIWCVNEQQKKEAEAFVKEQTAKGEFRGRKIVTQIEPAKTFYPAEAYHQDYIERTGGACHVANPW